jgi:hypothetical protein
MEICRPIGHNPSGKQRKPGEVVYDDILRTVLQLARTHIPPDDTPVSVSPESALSELGFQSLASTIADVIRPLVRG